MKKIYLVFCEITDDKTTKQQFISAYLNYENAKKVAETLEDASNQHLNHYITCAYILDYEQTH